MPKKVAVILSGCGFLDGSEIQEATLTLLYLNKAGAEVTCFAPNHAQMHVVDHVKAKPTADSRNILAESARITRGKIEPLDNLQPENFDALLMPGGFGAAKNLSDYAVKGKDYGVDEKVARVVQEFRRGEKTIGCMCIAPMVVAKALAANTQVTLTIGDDEATAADLEAQGAKHQNCNVDDIVTDEANKIVSTPAYMCDASIGDVATGIEKLVGKVLELA